MSIGITVKGNKYDVVVLGTTLAEAEARLKHNKAEITKFCGTAVQTKSLRKPTVSKKTSIASLALELKSEGFFDKPKSGNNIQKALQERGYTYPANSLTWPLQNLVRKRELGRIKKDDVWHYVKR